MARDNRSPEVHPHYRCPGCHSALAMAPASLRCEACGQTYPLEDGIADFSLGRYYDNYVPGQQLPVEHILGLEEEAQGATSRVQDFYLPLLRKRFRVGRSPGAASRVLDCGCGNGLAV